MLLGPVVGEGGKEKGKFLMAKHFSVFKGQHAFMYLIICLSFSLRTNKIKINLQ